MVGKSRGPLHIIMSRKEMMKIVVIAALSGYALSYVLHASNKPRILCPECTSHEQGSAAATNAQCSMCARDCLIALQTDTLVQEISQSLGVEDRPTKRLRIPPPPLTKAAAPVADQKKTAQSQSQNTLYGGQDSEAVRKLLQENPDHCTHAFAR